MYGTSMCTYDTSYLTKFHFLLSHKPILSVTSNKTWFTKSFQTICYKLSSLAIKTFVPHLQWSNIVIVIKYIVSKAPYL